MTKMTQMTDMTVFEQILKIILKLTCGLRKQPTPNAFVHGAPFCKS